MGGNYPKGSSCGGTVPPLWVGTFSRSSLIFADSSLPSIYDWEGRKEGESYFPSLHLFCPPPGLDPIRVVVRRYKSLVEGSHATSYSVVTPFVS